MLFLYLIWTKNIVELNEEVVMELMRSKELRQSSPVILMIIIKFNRHLFFICVRNTKENSHT